MRPTVVVLALVLSLAACSTEPVVKPTAALGASVRQLADVDSSELRLVQHDDGREDELVVEVTTPDDIDATRLTALVDDATALIDDAEFDDVGRQLRVTIGDDLLAVTADGGDPLQTQPMTDIFIGWWSDPRVDVVRWDWTLDLELVGDATTDGSLVKTVYDELVTDPLTLERGGLEITDPGSFSIAASEHPFTENRFGLASEIDAVDGVSACSFNLVASSDGSFEHKVYCSAAGDLDATGASINALLDARGLRESTYVRLQGPDDSIVTNEGGSVFDES